MHIRLFCRLSATSVRKTHAAIACSPRSSGIGEQKAECRLAKGRVVWYTAGTMLKGISPVVSPELLKILAEMGHGDEIVISDAHFPGHAMNSRVVRADGVGAVQLLAGIIPLLELDSYATPVVMMAAVEGDEVDPAVEMKYREALGYDGKIERMERYPFYVRAGKAYAVVVSGETAKYGNIILKKGVIPTC